MSKIKRSFWHLIAENDELIADKTIGELEELYKRFDSDPQTLEKQKGEQTNEHRQLAGQPSL